MAGVERQRPFMAALVGVNAPSSLPRPSRPGLSSSVARVEGLPIESAGRGDPRFLEALGAFGASVLGTSEALGRELGQGLTIGAICEYDHALVTVEPLGDYAAVVTLAESAASLGRVRHTVRASSDELLRLLDMR